MFSKPRDSMGSAQGGNLAPQPASAFVGGENNLIDMLPVGEQSLAKRVHELTALYHFTNRLHCAETLQDVYDSALEAILTALRCSRASILLFDESGTMRFVGSRGLSENYRKSVEGLSPWQASEKDAKPICINDIDCSSLSDAAKANIKAEGIGAMAFIPLTPDGKLIGKFMTYYETAHVFTDDEVALALTIARQVAFRVARKRAEEALRESEQRERARAAELQAIMEAVPAVIWIAHDPDCRVITGNRASYEFLRLQPETNPSLTAPEGDRPTSFNVLVNGRVLSPEELPVQRAARGEEVLNFEEEVRFSDNTSRYLLGNAKPLRDADGNAYGAVTAFVDITERKQAESHREMLLAELSHRVKNTLATVISIAHQSFSRDAHIDHARRSFDARIRALAQSHERLAEANWNGVWFERIVLEETAPYRREDGSNIRASGPSVSLNPKYAVTLGMALHELTTNAAKYGPLSGESGLVDIGWEITPDKKRFCIRWIESGGPLVAPPTRSGFGRLLLERAVALDLKGKVKLDFAPEGFKCTMDLPLEPNSAAN